MERLRDEGIVIRENLSFYESETESGELAAVRLAGYVRGACDLFIRVEKKLMVQRDDHNRYMVRTKYYQYHAMCRSRPGRPRRDLVRIDNAHDEMLHRHVFDTAGIEIERVPMSLDAMPTLDEFIRHAMTLASN